MQNFTPDPHGFQYSPINWYAPPPPESPARQEKKRLRKDGNTVGLMMLALCAAMQGMYTGVVLFLCLMGVLDFQALGSQTLGLNNAEYLVLYGVIYVLSMGLPPLLVALCRRCRFSPFGPAKTVSAGDAFFGVLGCMGVCMIANLLASLVLSFFAQFGIEAPEMPYFFEPTSGNILLNVLIVAVLPALLEEMVFRGYILRLLRPYGDLLAIAVSAVLFALMHGNISQIPFALVVGVSLGWLYVRTDNIWLPIAVHFANNTLSVCANYLSAQLVGDWQSIYSFAVIVAVAVTGGISLLILIMRRSPLLFGKSVTVSALSASDRLSTLAGAPALVISTILFIILTVVKTV